MIDCYSTIGGVEIRTERALTTAGPAHKIDGGKELEFPFRPIS